MSTMKDEPKAGIPAWLVSFGDMMTLILTFFILLVSMSTERNFGMMANGLGSFVVALKSHGLPSVLSAQERQEIFNEFRRRFNLPPEADPERRDDHRSAADLELIRAAAARALTPHDELFQPLIATFEPDSAELSDEARSYLDRLAQTLRPASRQLLLLEGHAVDAGPRFGNSNIWLANSRARVVRLYLIEQHQFQARRVEARAWVEEIVAQGAATRGVDARLVTPQKQDQ